jgi:hypothetical protein
MINVIKSQPAPDCLAIEKAKGTRTSVGKNGKTSIKIVGDYNCGEVLIRLKNDFHNKCYLCEDKGLTTINTEHFVPHQGDIDLAFDWDNLFSACGHCNNTKLAMLLKLLNCTDSSIKITDLIEFKAFGLPKERFVIKAAQQNPTVETQNTVKLLNSIYSGTTKLKEIESENLRERVSNEVAGFTKHLKKFYKYGLTQEEKEKYKTKIRRKLSPESPFTAFKIWIIKSNDFYLRDFGSFLN